MSNWRSAPCIPLMSWTHSDLCGLRLAQADQKFLGHALGRVYGFDRKTHIPVGMTYWK